MIKCLLERERELGCGLCRKAEVPGMAVRLMICIRLLNLSKRVKDGGTGKTIMGELHFSN